MLNVDHICVFSVRFSDSSSEAVFSFGDCNEMQMVVHKTVNPDGDALFSRMKFEELEIKCLVVLLEKNFLTAIAPLNDMMGITWDDDTGEAWHVWQLLFWLFLESSYIVKDGSRGGGFSKIGQKSGNRYHVPLFLLFCRP